MLMEYIIHLSSYLITYAALKGCFFVWHIVTKSTTDTMSESMFVYLYMRQTVINAHMFAGEGSRK